MTNTGTAPARIPSVSELQAAVLAARSGQFATVVTPAANPAPVAPSSPAPAEDLPGATAAAPEAEADAPTTVLPAVAPTAAPPPISPSGAAFGGSGVWLLGTHGGSGVRCLSTVLPGTRYAGKAWPAPQTGREPVVLVCRGNHRGLSSAQDYARAYRDSGPGGIADQVQLVGVIVSADAPGRTPTALRRLERLLSGATPILGHVPWEPTWRLGPASLPPEGTEPLPWVSKLARALEEALTGAAVRP